MDEIIIKLDQEVSISAENQLASLLDTLSLDEKREVIYRSNRPLEFPSKDAIKAHKHPFFGDDTVLLLSRYPDDESVKDKIIVSIGAGIVELDQRFLDADTLVYSASDFLTDYDNIMASSFPEQGEELDAPEGGER